MKHLSLADIHEPELVEMLMRDLLYRNNLVAIHGILSNVIHKTSVSMEGLPKNDRGKHPKGDIDILLVPPASPENSVAIEVKRIKVHRTTFGDQGIPNGIQELTKGVRQANLLSQIGFNQVYYFVLVIIDSRHNNSQEHVTFKGLTQELNNLVTQEVSSLLKTLDARIGLRRFDLIQPMDYEPLGTGASHSHLVRLANPISQSSEITEWVKQVINQ